MDSETSSRLTPLMLSAQKGYEDIALSLLNAGADVNFVDVNKNTALHYAVIHG